MDKSEDTEMKTCYFCRGPVHRRTIEYMGRRPSGYYLVKDVEAEVCEHCGETYLSPESVQHIESAWDRIVEPQEHLRIPGVYGGSA